MTPKRISTHHDATLPLRAAAAIGAVAMVTLGFAVLVVLPAKLDAQYATVARTRTLVEVIGPRRLDRAAAWVTPGDRTRAGSGDTRHASAKPDRMLDRVATRSGRTRDSHGQSGSLD